MFKFQPKCSFIKDLYEKATIGSEYELWGNVKNIREQSSLIFVTLYDGTHITPFQLILDLDKYQELYQFKGKLHTGAYIKVKGIVVESPAKGQKIEMQVKKLILEGPVRDVTNYLPLVKGVNLETLRGKNSYIRPKFQTYQAVYTIVDKTDKFINDFMREIEFKKIDPNIMTISECEGGAAVFTVTTMLNEKTQDIPSTKDGLIDYSKDFFGKKVGLTVSSQLQLEALVSCGKGVYTTNKSFRAEKSATSRHLCEFSHFEAESRLIVTLEDLMNHIEDLITYVINHTLSECKEELKVLNSFISIGIISRLESFINMDFGRLSYSEAINLIKKDKKQIKKLYDFDEEINWGDDIPSKCERYIAEQIFKRPVFIFNFPRDLKSFYMKANEPDSEGRVTVQSCDLLVPGCGEIVGASVRISDYDELIKEMTRREMDMKPLDWYIDLRKNGNSPSAGYGLGIGRLHQILCYTDSNIRDVTPFPVAFGECHF